jgi:cellulose synthase/poly-beta-1,6-N-acetylglucosamine synthase-like glycosyltransferase
LVVSTVVQFVALPSEEARERLEASISALDRATPSLSAKKLLTPRHRNVLIAAVLILIILGVLTPINTVIGVISVITVFYLGVSINRALLFSRSRRRGTQFEVTDEEARAVPDADLPVYTILVPAYREPEVIHRLLQNLDQLEYPRDRLDLKLLLEEDDFETIEALQHLEPGEHIQVVLVPAAQPRTKPKALNYGLSLARGDIVTIYDVEDRPEPLQLRRAVAALARADPEVVCLQAKLSYANVDQNLITQWFTIEYDMWFSLFLPGMVQLDAPVPLGGTSNHFRREVLEELGAWDPHNVTEDADLGIRLARRGYRSRVLDSLTLEEANSDFVNWVKQRSRWYKGYLQTFLIHMRHPRQVFRQIGTVGVLELVLFVGGTPLLALLNPLFWLMTALWFAGRPHIIRDLFPAPLYYASLVSWVFGNFLAAYLTLLAIRLNNRTHLIKAALLVPLYWLMMGVAAAKAVWQLVATPTFWEKTTHGLDQGSSPQPGEFAEATPG